jgi:hypothetical protein
MLIKITQSVSFCHFISTVSTYYERYIVMFSMLSKILYLCAFNIKSVQLYYPLLNVVTNHV